MPRGKSYSKYNGNMQVFMECFYEILYKKTGMLVAKKKKVNLSQISESNINTKSYLHELETQLL